MIQLKTAYSETPLSNNMIVRECMRMFFECLGTIKPRYNDKIEETEYEKHIRTVSLKFGHGIRYYSVDSFADGAKLKKRFTELVKLIEDDCPQTIEYRILQLVTYPLPCEGEMQRLLFNGVSLRLRTKENESVDEFYIDICYTFEPLIA